MVEYQMSQHASSCLIVGLVHDTEPRYVKTAVSYNNKKACNQRKSRSDLTQASMAFC